MTIATHWERAADPTRRVGHAVEFHSEIASTNDRARAALSEPGGSGRAIVADLQTAGRGRLGRTWLSPPAVNLMVSVGLRPSVTPASAWRLGAAAALAACEACEPLDPLFVKWPNDLYTEDGLKVGGILVETALNGDRLAHAVIGLGLNVNWSRSEMPSDVARSATSLRDLHGGDVDRVALLRRYLAALDVEIDALEAGASPVERLRRRSWLDGRRVQVETTDGPIEGDALGIGDDGALLVRDDLGVRSVLFGDVIHVAPGGRAAA
ncbi:MAG: biotin--[acetyl-CoA-carboxylase] ligase [Candidatus Limnocylindria bacterium]